MSAPPYEKYVLVKEVPDAPIAMKTGPKERVAGMSHCGSFIFFSSTN